MASFAYFIESDYGTSRTTDFEKAKELFKQEVFKNSYSVKLTKVGRFGGSPVLIKEFNKVKFIDSLFE